MRKFVPLEALFVYFVLVSTYKYQNIAVGPCITHNTLYPSPTNTQIITNSKTFDD